MKSKVKRNNSSVLWYNKFISENLLASMSCDASPKNNKRYLKYNLISIGVEGFLPIVSQFLYLFILTNKNKPFFARKYPSKKKYKFGDTVGDTAKYAVYINKRQSKSLLAKLYLKLMRRQLTPEKPTIWLNHTYTKIITWNAILTEETNGMELNQNAFLPHMPIYYKFFSQKALLKEIMFWIKFYDWLRPTNKNVWYLQLSYYHFWE